jgi:hypothetical protein
VTAAKFAEVCDAAGLCCISQELVNWRQRLLIDAFSVFTHKDSKWARPNKVFNNHSFMKEVEQISGLSELYYFPEAPSSLPGKLLTFTPTTLSLPRSVQLLKPSVH